MKKRKLLALLAMAALTANAQSKLDLQSLARMQELREQVETSALQKGLTAKKAAQQETIEVVVKMHNGTDAAALAAKGFDLKANRGEFAVVSMPLSRIEELNDIESVESIGYGKRRYMRLSVAHPQTGVDKVQAGEGLDMPYTGKGIIIGDVDQGFDPAHPFFLDKDGNTRVTMYYLKARSITDPAAIVAAGVDQTSTYHGSHVIGIAAGNYQGDDFSISGVAPEADIAMAAYSQGYDSELITIIEKLVNFAAEQKKPLVINLSLGDNAGPHDDSDQLTQYLNKVVDDNAAVVCIAAGNEGTYPIVQKKTFASDTDEMTAYLYEDADMVSYYGYNPSCSLWAKGTEPFNVSFVLYNTSTKKILKRYDPDVNILKSSGSTADEDFSKYFSGTLRMTRKANETTGKYGVDIKFSGTRLVSSVVPGYVVTASAGREVVCYASDWTYLISGLQTTMYGTNYVPAEGVTADGTINNMAAGMKGICVGSYNSRDKGTNKNGTTFSLSSFGETNELGDVSAFSSWGTIDGVAMPDIAAPGSLVESATTTEYIRSMGAYDGDYTKSLYKNGKYYYWKVNMGTSMATPYMSGVAALWLQADPTLTTAKIKEIAKSTAIKDDKVKATANPVQFGAGKIDAYNGLKYVLDHKASALGKVDSDKDMLFRQTADNVYEAYVAGETAITVNIFDMSGRLVYSKRTAGNTSQFSLASMPKGIYAVELCGSKTSHKLKVAVK